MRYKMIVAYDGTDYHGWQEQANAPTIVGALQDVFLKVFHQPCVIVGASRTDAGVHARGQVATFTTDLAINPLALLNAWNNKLPPAIHLRELVPADDHYNPHLHVLQKEYHYALTFTRPSPFDARFVWHYRWPVDIEKLQKALTLFIGQHDFRSFCTGAELVDTVRSIDNICLEQTEKNNFVLVFKAKSFLHHMIRRITGACLEIAARPNLPIAYLESVLAAKNPQHTLPCAPACGLMLVKILYKN